MEVRRDVVYLDDFVVRIAVTPPDGGPTATVLMSRDEFRDGYQRFLAGQDIRNALPTLNRRYQKRLEHGRD